MRTRILADLDTRWQASPESPHHSVWLTTADVARMLELTSEGVRDLVRRQQLVCQRTRAGWRLFRFGDVQRLAERRMTARLTGKLRVQPRARGEPRQLSLFGSARLRLVR